MFIHYRSNTSTLASGWSFVAQTSSLLGGQMRFLRQNRLVSSVATVRQSALPGFGVIVSAQGENIDFVPRFFAPNAGIPEDPVTGSTHSTLIPFWAGRLGKKESEMTALQLSRRGGKLKCRHAGNRVKISGTAVLYLEGEIKI